MIKEKITPQKDFNELINSFLEWFKSTINLALFNAKNRSDITIDINWFDLYTTDEIKTELRKNVPMEISDKEMEETLHYFIHTIVLSAIKTHFENTSTAEEIMEVLTELMTQTLAQWIYDEMNTNEDINSYIIESTFIYYPIEDNQAYIDGVRFHMIGSNEE